MRRGVRRRRMRARLPRTLSLCLGCIRPSSRSRRSFVRHRFSPAMKERRRFGHREDATRFATTRHACARGQIRSLLRGVGVRPEAARAAGARVAPGRRCGQARWGRPMRERRSRPFGVPCATRHRGRLRNSPSSRRPLQGLALRSSNSARRLPRDDCAARRLRRSRIGRPHRACPQRRPGATRAPAALAASGRTPTRRSRAFHCPHIIACCGSGRSCPRV